MKRFVILGIMLAAAAVPASAGGVGSTTNGAVTFEPAQPLTAAGSLQISALVQSAQAHLAAADATLSEVRKRIENPPDQGNEGEPAPVAGSIDLATFAWAGSKTSDPVGLPAGAKYGEGVEGGKRFCQWKWSDLILHAVMPAATRTATGGTVRWYHFTAGPGGEPDARLAAYRWTAGAVATDKTGTWRKWTLSGAAQ